MVGHVGRLRSSHYLPRRPEEMVPVRSSRICICCTDRDIHSTSSSLSACTRRTALYGGRAVPAVTVPPRRLPGAIHHCGRILGRKTRDWHILKHHPAPLWVVRERSIEILHFHRAPNIALVSPSPSIHSPAVRETVPASDLFTLQRTIRRLVSASSFSSRRRRKLPCDDGESTATSIRLACICPHLSIMRDASRRRTAAATTCFGATSHLERGRRVWRLRSCSLNRHHRRGMENRKCIFGVYGGPVLGLYCPSQACRYMRFF
ncbi:hypothetical protein C8Q73DRAFT_675913 [Cubamyces lactineus]|nr:hypothetical protein C8Q73DRAFT_675913 [Cubamyces lactineus]